MSRNELFRKKAVNSVDTGSSWGVVWHEVIRFKVLWARSTL